MIVRILKIAFVVIISLSGMSVVALAQPLTYADMESIYRDHEGGGDSLRKMVYGILKKGDYAAALDRARILRSIGHQYSDPQTEMYADAVVGSSFIYLRNADSASYCLTRSIELGKRAKFDWGLAFAYNGMGLYVLNFGTPDCYTAIRYFATALEAARRGGNDAQYSTILANIAYVYYLKDDPDGLPYAKECYELGLAHGDNYLTYIGSFVSAAIYFLLEDYDKAVSYIEIASRHLQADDGEMSKYRAVAAYTLHGRILMTAGYMVEAKALYDKALSFKSALVSDELVTTYTYYGDYYMMKREYPAALGMYSEGIELAARMDNQVYNTNLYRRMAELYEAIGNYPRALYYEKRYTEMAGNLFNIEKEQSINEMKVRYDLEKKDIELERNQLLLHYHRNATRIMLLVLIIAVVVLASVIYYYKQRSRFYRQIFRQTQDALHARERLRLAAESAAAESATSSAEPDDAKYASSPLSDEMGRKLFADLEALMERDAIYRRPDLSVDMLAEMVGSNRSYLSRIINEYSGLNFNNYINKYRINEAVSILSDTNNDIPLKVLASDLGFNNLTTFYSSFHREIGMPPSRYRKTARTAHKQGE
jgi:AraC-like DNA-binding protein